MGKIKETVPCTSTSEVYNVASCRSGLNYSVNERLRTVLRAAYEAPRPLRRENEYDSDVSARTSVMNFNPRTVVTVLESPLDYGRRTNMSNILNERAASYSAIVELD